jgi:lipopolysaccharide export LptBFGC system permease protein LptF
VAALRLLHRYLLIELVRNAIVSLVVVFAIFFLAALSLQVGKAKFENLPMIVILKAVALLMLYTGYLTIPLAVVTTCIFTYGRAAQDGEISAAQTSGIQLWSLLVPAVFLGACAMLGLAVLQDRVMPEAHFRSRIVDESVFRNVDELLKQKNHEIRDKSFVFKWGTVGEDASRNLILENVELTQYDAGKVASWTEAKRARPVAEPDSPRITLELFDLHRSDVRTGTSFWGARLDVPIDLSALTEPRRRTKESDLSYEELLSEAASPQSVKRSNRLDAEFHFRIAMALSALLFALFAAPFGIAFRLRNRAVVFLAGILIMVVGYMPIVSVGKSLAERGVLPAWAGLQAGNVALLVLAACFAARSRRT